MLICQSESFKMNTINGYTLDQIKAGFAAMEQNAADSTIKTYTVDELICELKQVASKSPQGGMTKVRIGDWEGNLSANGLVETLEVKFDPGTSRVVIYCDPNEY